MFQENIRLADYSNYKIGGRARYFFEPKTVAEIAAAVKRWKGPLFVLGGGTNILFSDDGFPGLVMHPRILGLAREGNAIQVGAGVAVGDLLNFAASESLSGLEWAGGLPGTVGGAIRGNAGAFRGETKDAIREVTSLDISGSLPKTVRRNNSECRFGYRNSIFKEKDIIGDGRKEIILETVFDLKPGKAEEIRKGIQEKIDYRNERHPMESPNIGSIFKNVPVARASEALLSKARAVVKNDPFPVIPTAYLISEAGLQGRAAGGAMISPKHPNFIVNANQATASDVRTLIALVREEIKKMFRIDLEEEVIIL